MRIDLQNTYVSSLDDLQKTSPKTAELNQREIGGESSANVRLSNIAQQATEAPEIREDRVAQLRQEIDSGTYSVSNEALADAMMRDLLQR